MLPEKRNLSILRSIYLAAEELECETTIRDRPSKITRLITLAVPYGKAYNLTEDEIKDALRSLVVTLALGEGK